MKKQNRIFAFALAIILCAFMNTSAFAAGSNSGAESNVSEIIERINAEYGTSIRALTDEELLEYGIHSTSTDSNKSFNASDFEKTLRDIVENQIPEFERLTQEAYAAIERAGVYLMATDEAARSETSALRSSYGPVTATKAINYATAAAQAYITEDSYGNTIWGSIVSGVCYTNTNQSTWFMASNPSVSHTDGNRSLYWIGTGDYFSNINGTHVYLYSGTQYASMYVGNYD